MLFAAGWQKCLAHLLTKYTARNSQPVKGMVFVQRLITGLIFPINEKPFTSFEIFAVEYRIPAG
jgi:hypothetical protein